MKKPARLEHKYLPIRLLSFCTVLGSCGAPDYQGTYVWSFISRVTEGQLVQKAANSPIVVVKRGTVVTVWACATDGE